ncbi:hypothetical protein DFP94_11854 [Fontibacillus phaseoli]|uniref:Uncharacterized protein n=1 Tax=Fontibacillus phaseoli TaxID=1416533 RepID=A0A369AX82_9BACL|nr:hypothetical protein DFP94_11854 [Fontibacillus phaseoli]
MGVAIAVSLGLISFYLLVEYVRCRIEVKKAIGRLSTYEAQQQR